MDVIGLGLDDFMSQCRRVDIPCGIGAMARVLLLNQRLGLASNDISQRTNNSPIEAVGLCEKL
jgi:hypothetical protein